jgi:hypothetical protein
MSWDAIDSYYKVKLKIAQDKYWDLFKNISLACQSLNMLLVLNCFLGWTSICLELNECLNKKKDNRYLIKMNV